MRFAAAVLLGALCINACAEKRARPSNEVHRERCDPVMVTRLESRTEGAFVHIDTHRSQQECEGPSREEVTPIARIAASSKTPACPIGEVALRAWDRGRSFQKTLPEFVSTLHPHGLDAVSVALRQFADRASAFVIACPDPTHASWLIVETSPGAAPPRTELFVDDQLAPERQHPHVTFLSGAAGPSLPETVSVPIATDAGAGTQAAADCSALEAQAGTRWIGRQLYTGILPGPHTLRTYAFGLVGDRATLVVEEQTARKPPAKGAAWDWQCKQSTSLAGTVATREKRLIFRFADPSRPSDVQEMTCKIRNLRVAAASAVRIAVPPPLTEEGCNKHRWSPAAAIVQRALECTSDGTSVGRSSSFVFAGPPPGIEHITLDEDDCGDPREALRLIPSNHGVAPVRRPP